MSKESADSADAEKKPQITTTFWLTSDAFFDPQSISQRVPLTPTFTATQGDLRPGKRPPVPRSNWRIQCHDRRIQSIDEGVCEVLDIVWPHRAVIVQAMDELGLIATFESYVRIRELGVVYEFSRETVLRMADLRAEWIMDLYDWSK